jgi:hypothetical protein
MSNPDDRAEEERREAEARGDGVDLSVTDARAGVRRGVSKILILSTVLAIIALIIVWGVAHEWNYFI